VTRRHPADRLVAASARWVMKPLLGLPLPWSVHRRGLAVLAPPAFRPTPCAESWEEIGGVPCLVVRPPNAQGIVVWLHGGGFVLGSAGGWRSLARGLAIRSGRSVVLPDYRLAPEHPFPAAPEDAVAVARAVAVRGAPWGLGGDSAGGNLALGACARMLAEGRPPDRLALASPAPDLRPGRPGSAGVDEMLLHDRMLRRALRDYLRGAEADDPRASPILADFTGGPATLIQCASRELLEADCDALAGRLAAQGVPVRMEKAHDMPHDYQIFLDISPEASRAVDRLGAFLRGDA
jgi:acetyl esterase/lipase